MPDSQAFQDGYKEGKTQSIEVLERVLASMKSTIVKPSETDVESIQITYEEIDYLLACLVSRQMS